MKRFCIPVLAGLVSLGLTAQAMAAEPALKDPKARKSYVLGLDIANSIKSQLIDVDPKMVAKGFSDLMNGVEPQVSKDEWAQIMADYKQEMGKKMADAQQASAQANLEKGKAFLAENGKKDGVVTTASGLQYKVLTPGEGQAPKAEDKVTVHYRGTLIDGTEFDSSYGRGQPATFPLNQVIKGWTEGVQLMKPGAKYVFYIPSELAYGSRGPGKIGPNQALIFEVELLKVN